MKIFLDTSVLVAAVVHEHGSHAPAYAVLDRVQNEKDDGYISAHSVAETYSVLTKSPPPIRHAPEQALLSIEENILRYFKTVSLSGSDYASLIRDAALAGIQGGTIYDAVLLKCAMESDAEKIFTFNLKHFQSVASATIRSRIVSP